MQASLTPASASHCAPVTRIVWPVTCPTVPVFRATSRISATTSSLVAGHPARLTATNASAACPAVVASARFAAATGHSVLGHAHANVRRTPFAVASVLLAARLSVIEPHPTPPRQTQSSQRRPASSISRCNHQAPITIASTPARGATGLSPHDIIDGVSCNGCACFAGPLPRLQLRMQSFSS